jgi:hypothetical protein
MPHPFIAATMIAALIAVMLVWRKIVIALVDAGGLPITIAIVATCFALACLIHHRETRGY